MREGKIRELREERILNSKEEKRRLDSGDLRELRNRNQRESWIPELIRVGFRR